MAAVNAKVNQDKGFVFQELQSRAASLDLADPRYDRNFDTAWEILVARVSAPRHLYAPCHVMCPDAEPMLRSVTV